ncbi:TY-Chap domain-containing protein [Nocardia sp. IBHARD005]|uniref:TY-Chap domain-containing protein n=1 Tax=Nocardia sp. IBHARD005 TaxID=3457765 RepID=UPI004059F7DA
MDIKIADWAELSAALAVTFTRIPRNGYLRISVSEGSFVEFVMLPGGLRAEIATPDDEVELVVPVESKSGEPGWVRQLGWPVRYCEYEALAADVIGGLRDVLRVESPTELSFEVRVLSSSADTYDVEALKYNPQSKVEHW